MGSGGVAKVLGQDLLNGSLGHLNEPEHEVDIFKFKIKFKGLKEKYLHV